MKCANKKLTFSHLWPNVNFLLGQQCTLVRPDNSAAFLIASGRTGVRPHIVNQRIKGLFYAE